MKAIISTTMRTDASRMWEELQKTASLMQVAAPILVFRPQDGQPMASLWEVGKTYAVNLYAFDFLPLGKHTIYVSKIDSAGREIFTNEQGSLTKTWNHCIRIEPLNDTTVRYTDEIEIGAGIMTLFIWAFAHVFYRHRQRKWKMLLANYRKVAAA